jgi:putative protein-disulfide isomerase
VAVRLRYHTDPACPASWALEPRLRLLRREFGAEVDITYVMGGLARDYPADRAAIVMEWLDAAARSGMPLDPRVWAGSGAIRSTYPACMAVKAAAEQGAEAASRYLRALREGILCRARKLDAPEALVEEARGIGLDAERFRIDLGSHAIVEAFGADLEEARAAPEEVRGHGFPSLHFVPAGEAGSETWCAGAEGYERWREAAREAGAQVSGESPPDALGALRRFGRMAAPEVEAVCELPGPRANAELWRLAADWRVKHTRFLTGELWELA